MHDSTPISATANRLNKLQMDCSKDLSKKLTPSGSKRNLSTNEDNQTPKAKVKRGRPPLIKKGFFGNRPPSSTSSNNDEENIGDNNKKSDNDQNQIPLPPGFEPPGFELPVNHQVVTDENKVNLMPPPQSTEPIKRGRPRKSLDASNEPQKPKERTRPPSERLEVV